MTTTAGPLSNPPSCSLERARYSRFARCFALRASYIGNPIFKSIYVPNHSSGNCKADEILADVKNSCFSSNVALVYIDVDNKVNLYYL